MRRIFLLFIFVFNILLCGCSLNREIAFIPEKYCAEAIVTSYANENGDIKEYSCEINKNDQNYSIKFISKDVVVNISIDENKISLSNEKFKDCPINANVEKYRSYIDEIDISRFYANKREKNNIVLTKNGNIEYKMEFLKDSKTPKYLKIYKNNAVIKIYEYKKMEIYQ